MPPDPLAGIHRLTDFEPLARQASRSGPSATWPPSARPYAQAAPSGTLRRPVRACKLTRSDGEATVAFKDAAVGRKTMLASLANLDVIG